MATFLEETDQDFEALVEHYMPNKARLVFVASGNTFPHRQQLKLHGWVWNYRDKTWTLDNGSDEDSEAVYFARRLFGVRISQTEVGGDASNA